MTISRGFWMGKYEVTQGEYLGWWGAIRVTSGTALPHMRWHWRSCDQRVAHPVEQVSWIDATNYCARLTERERVGGAVACGLCVSVADGGGVGVCVSGGDDDAVSLRAGVAFWDGEL